LKLKEFDAKAEGEAWKEIKAERLVLSRGQQLPRNLQDVVTNVVTRLNWLVF
jgi:hypothetical protein